MTKIHAKNRHSLQFKENIIKQAASNIQHATQ